MDEYQALDTNCKDSENAVEVQDASFKWDPTNRTDTKSSEKAPTGRNGYVIYLVLI